MLKHLKRSLFIKLLAVFFLTAVLLIILVSLSVKTVMRDSNPIHQQIISNLNQYSNYLIDDIGHPPTKTRVNKLSNTTGLEIKIAGPQIDISSPSFSSESLIRREYHDTEKPNIKVLHHRGSSVARVAHNDLVYYFVLTRKIPDALGSIILYSSIAILLVIIFSHFLVRRLLAPVRLLNRGLEEAANGNLNNRIEVRSQDELGQLSIAFNQMVEKLDQIIKSKEQLLRDISHELRSPLTRIGVATELLDQQTLADSIKDEIKILNRLIEDILNTSTDQKPTLSLEQLNIGKLIAEIIGRYHHTKPGIEYTPPEHDFFVELDQRKFSAALTNIIDNALKYSAHQNQPVTIWMNQSGQQLVIHILDKGNGIKPEDKQKIFEAFHRLDPSRNHAIPGFGLGLSIARNYIEMHDGKIDVESDGQSYADFMITLPLKI